MAKPSGRMRLTCALEYNSCTTISDSRLDKNSRVAIEQTHLRASGVHCYAHHGVSKKIRKVLRSTSLSVRDRTSAAANGLHDEAEKVRHRGGLSIGKGCRDRESEESRSGDHEDVYRTGAAAGEANLSEEGMAG